METMMSRDRAARRFLARKHDRKKKRVRRVKELRQDKQEHDNPVVKPVPIDWDYDITQEDW